MGVQQTCNTACQAGGRYRWGAHDSRGHRNGKCFVFTFSTAITYSLANVKALFAVATDGNNQLVPLAAAIVKSETEESWAYFIRLAVQQMPRLCSSEMCIMSDRCKGLENAVQSICGAAQHVLCTVHLVRNIAAHCGATGVKETVYPAASAPLRSDFDIAFNRLKELNEDAFNYISKIDPQLWAQSYSPNRRFFQITSNAVESLNSVLASARGNGPLKLITSLYDWIFEKFGDRAAEAALSQQPFTERATATLTTALEAAQRCIAKINGSQAQVCDQFKRTFAVSLTPPSCSCQCFAVSGLLCAHQLAAYAKAGMSWEAFIDRCWTTANQRELYSITVPAIATHDLRPEEISAPLFTSSCLRRKKRLLSKGETALPPQRQRVQKTLTGQPLGAEQVQEARAAAIADNPGNVQSIGGGYCIVQQPGAQTARAVDLTNRRCDCPFFKQKGECVHLRAASQAQCCAPPPEIVSTASLIHPK